MEAEINIKSDNNIIQLKKAKDILIRTRDPEDPITTGLLISAAARSKMRKEIIPQIRSKAETQ